MSRNARLRKLRREAKRQFAAEFSAQSGLSDALQRKHPDCMVVPNVAGEKMSEIIEDFAEPLLDGADSHEEVQKALAFAIIAWNYSLLDQVERAKSEIWKIQLFADPMIKDVFKRLLARKELLYPDNRRSIIDYELIPNGTEYQFNVVSTFG